MRLVHRAQVTTYEGKTCIHFDIQTLVGKRELSEEEYAWFCQQTKRMQLVTDRALGPDRGTVHVSEFNGHRNLMLCVEGTTITDDIRSMVGWIELFGLEHEEVHAEILATAFPLGNPGFAP